ncbi:hypothetical protein ACRYCC_02325 [Actinomadura scrupuli]|uniref:hypothetical protein n=1 Tax=Actinomadura scrupuli TaxID=559629 RepID=UPI003D98463F
MGGAGRHTGRFARAHGAFAVVLVVAIALRVIVLLGYPSVVWFGDSGTYLGAALHLVPSLIRPSGYSVLLWLLRPFHSLFLVAAVQHLLGVLTGVMVYALVRRAARARWPDARWPPGVLGALVTVPVLLDAYQIQLEQLLMADELFTFLMVAAVTVVMWRPAASGVITWRAASAAGLLMAFGALTRSAGLPLLIVLVVCLLVRLVRGGGLRAGWRPVCAAIVVFAIPMGAYVLWFHAAHKTYSLTRTDQIWLYGRTVDFADCTVMKPRPEVAALCRDGLPRDPESAAAWEALWGPSSAFRRIPEGVGGVEANRLAGEFARLAIQRQPGDYLKVIGRDTLRTFEWDRAPYPNRATMEGYRFPARPVPLSAADARFGRRYGGASATPEVVEPWAGWMRAYQRWFFLRGTMLGAVLLIGLAGILRQWRRWGGEALLPWLTSLALLVIPAATADFDYRYVLPAVPFAVLSAALAWLRPRDPAAPPGVAPDPEPALERPESAARG